MEIISRKQALKAVIALPAVAIAAVSMQEEADAAKGAKSQFKYQDGPKNGQKCSACRFYVAAKPHAAKGACTLVAGPISPNGWCIAYAKG